MTDERSEQDLEEKIRRRVEEELRRSRDRHGTHTEPENIREILGVVTDKVPALLRELRDVLYSKEAAQSMAEAVGTFYSKLVESGIPKDDALDMARGYMIDLRNILRSKTRNVGRPFEVELDDDDECEDEDDDDEEDDDRPRRRRGRRIIIN